MGDIVAGNEIELYQGSEPVVVGVQKVKTTTLRVCVEDNEDCTPPTEVTADLYHGDDFRACISVGRLNYQYEVDDNFIFQGNVVWDPAPMDNTNYTGRWRAQVSATGTTTDPRHRHVLRAAPRRCRGQRHS